MDEAGNIDHEKPGAYSWVTAIAYDNAPMEVGPLARLLVNRDEGFARLMQPFKPGGIGSSVMSRILARAYEANRLCSYLLEILELYDLQGPTINPPDMLARPTGIGQGMSMAARGALNHQVTTDEGKVTGLSASGPFSVEFRPNCQWPAWYGRAGPCRYPG